jgi:hypothetical protein
MRFDKLKNIPSDEVNKLWEAGTVPCASFTPITRDLMQMVLSLLDFGVMEAAAQDRPSGRPVRLLRTRFALPAYMLSGTAIESHINEIFLSDFSELAIRDSVLHKLPPSVLEVLEKMPKAEKLFALPQAVFGKSLDRGKQPGQDAVTLFRLRDELVHFKHRMENAKAENVAEGLAQRGIVLPDGLAGTPWQHRLYTLGGIAWAYNTMLSTIRALIMLGEGDAREMFLSNIRNLAEVTDANLEEKLAKVRKDGGMGLLDAFGPGSGIEVVYPE